MTAMLSTAEVCEIIRVAGAAKVISLRFKGLQLTFKETIDSQVQQVPSPPVSERDLRAFRGQLGLKLEEVPAEEAAEAGEIDRDTELAEANLGLLEIEDPLAMEMHILSGDATDGDGT